MFDGWSLLCIITIIDSADVTIIVKVSPQEIAVLTFINILCCIWRELLNKSKKLNCMIIIVVVMMKNLQEFLAFMGGRNVFSVFLESEMRAFKHVVFCRQ